MDTTRMDTTKLHTLNVSAPCFDTRCWKSGPESDCRNCPNRSNRRCAIVSVTGLSGSGAGVVHLTKGKP